MSSRQRLCHSDGEIEIYLETKISGQRNSLIAILVRPQTIIIML